MFLRVITALLMFLAFNVSHCNDLCYLCSSGVSNIKLLVISEGVLWWGLLYGPNLIELVTLYSINNIPNFTIHKPMQFCVCLCIEGVTQLISIV